MPSLDEIINRNVNDIRSRVAAACTRANRDPRDVTIIAVSKYIGPEVIDALVRAGVTDIGENRLQVAEPKLSAITVPKPRCHFIGPLQTNKTRPVLELFDAIHSLDRMGLADSIQRKAEELGKRVPCFVEVNIGSEPQKAGFGVAQVYQAIREIAATCSNITLEGMMCIPPACDNAEDSRKHFKALAKLRRNAVEEGFAPDRFNKLSMGMSSDFEIAIEEGATHIRVGAALYRGLPGFE